jgi:hypothetical protein
VPIKSVEDVAFKKESSEDLEKKLLWFGFHQQGE